MDSLGDDVEDAQWKALSYGLTAKQYVDAVKLSYVKGDITRQTRALALCMKYPPDQWVLLLRAAADMLLERARLRG